MSFKYGVSLYSFMHDFGTVLDLEDCFRIVAETGSTGIEILGEGHVPNYPSPSNQWIDHWFELLQKYQLEPTNYGSWIDTRLRPGSTIDVDTAAGMLTRDLKLAKQLGFKFVRPKIGVVSSELDPDPVWEPAVERNLDLAKELDVIICPEIHSPTPIKHPVVEGYVNLIERTGTKHFGLLIDTGIFQDRPIPLRPGETKETRPAFLDGIGVDPKDLLDVMDYVVFVQAKFHDIDDSLEDQNIPWVPVLQALKDGGYQGYLSSEYEGDRSPWRSVEQVRRHHALMRQVEQSLS
jgi:sugar phosphate isomerase/epimerase